jgi:hypothetical protein
MVMGNSSFGLFTLRIILVICHLGFTFCLLEGQTVEQNDQGERIVRFDDGSWRYYEPGDSVLVSPSEEVVLQRKINQSEGHLEELRDQLASITERLLVLEQSLDGNKYNRPLFRESIDSLSREEEKYRDLIQNIESELDQMILQLSSMSTSSNLPPPPSKQKKNSEEKRSQYYIPYYMTANPTPCNTTSSRISGSGAERIATEVREWFVYTPPLLAHKYPDNGFLQCRASILFDGKQYYIQLQIKMNSTKASKEYGWIDKGSPLLLLTMRGNTVELEATEESIGQVDSGSNATRYSVVYSLSPSNLNILKSEGINKLRIVWSSGYEDYDIYKVNFLKNQIRCITTNIN